MSASDRGETPSAASAPISVAAKAITSRAVNDSGKAVALVTIKTSHGAPGSQNVHGVLNSWKNSRTDALWLSVQITLIKCPPPLPAASATWSPL